MDEFHPRGLSVSAGVVINPARRSRVLSFRCQGASGSALALIASKASVTAAQSVYGLVMSDISDLGPLGPLLGTWEGDKGLDLAPSDKSENNRELATSKYRERMIFEATGRVDNHEQQLFGLRYSTTAWRIGADDPFHEELGYWMWDPKSEVIIRSFMPPRGLTVLAGGTAKADARAFSLEAKAGSEVYGICSSPFLTAEFKTVRYTLDVKVIDDNTLYYDSHIWLQMKGRPDLFDHQDENTLTRS